MILDKELQLASNMALGNVATATLTNIVDLGSAGRDLGKYPPVAVIIAITEAMTSADSTATCLFILRSNDNEDMTTTPTTLYTTPAYGVTDLTLGKIIVLPFPQGGMAAADRYVGVVKTVGTQNTTAGKISAYLVFEWPSSKVA